MSPCYNPTHACNNSDTHNTYTKVNLSNRRKDKRKITRKTCEHEANMSGLDVWNAADHTMS